MPTLQRESVEAEPGARRAPSARLTVRRAAQGALVAVVVVSLPLAGVAVFTFDADRNTAGDAVSVVFFGALVALLTSPWWPLGGETRSRFERLQSTVLIWLGITYTTHLTWELGWLLFRGAIQSAPDAIWSYPWWAYIDGGDARYAASDSILVTLETLSVINGLVGIAALWLRHRSKGRSALAVQMIMATAVVHLYSTFVYFSTEILDGYPNVDTSSAVDLVIKFILLNGIWLVMPWLVLYWGHRTLAGLRSRPRVGD